MQIANSPEHRSRNSSQDPSFGLPTTYEVRFLDADGTVLSKQQVKAAAYSAVLKNLSNVADDATRIEVYNQTGESAGEVGIEYWRKHYRRR